MVTHPSAGGVCICRQVTNANADAPRRRSFLRLLAGIGGTIVFTRHGTSAQQRPAYEAMLLSCIDPRIIDPVHNYMNARGLDGKYSQFTIAGAAIAAEAKVFTSWHQTFWDNLATSIELHKINSVIAIDHRDCGAARIAYGAESIAIPSAETATHKRVLAAFRRDVQRLHPRLVVETGLMALNGTIEMFT